MHNTTTKLSRRQRIQSLKRLIRHYCFAIHNLTTCGADPILVRYRVGQRLALKAELAKITGGRAAG